MRLVKVLTGNLMSGMFVAELDRSWLETRFLVQGFMVHDQEDIDKIAHHVVLAAGMLKDVVSAW